MEKLSEPKQLLSVIIPAYKQEKTIVKDLKRIEEVLKRIRYDYEMICVVDGKVDKTYANARKIHSPKLKVFGYRKNLGKGHAVRFGMSKAKGDPIAFIDAGMDINPKGIPLLLEHMLWYGSDVIVGSIRHSASRVYNYPLKRKIYSWAYHLLTKWLFGLRITDSQRGLKIFKRKVLEKVLPRLLVKDFAFDIEMLAVARRLGFEKIHDGPVELDAVRYRDSTIKVRDGWWALIDTLTVFYRLYILQYYDDYNYRRWNNNHSLNLKTTKK